MFNTVHDRTCSILIIYVILAVEDYHLCKVCPVGVLGVINI